jgi:DNA-binding FrmR family transcriptional regulator
MKTHDCTDSKEILTGLKKAHTSLNRVIAMTENGEYCVDIMQQNLAVIGLLKNAHQKLMERHLHTCFLEGMETGSQAKRNAMIEEIQSVMKMGGR